MTNVDFDALKQSKSIGTARGWKPKPGENRIRVLPPSKVYISPDLGGDGAVLNRMDLSFRSHFLRIEGQDLHVFRCPKDADAHCPACAFYWKHRESTDAGVSKMAKRFNNSLRFLLNIVDLSEPDKGVQTYETGPMVRNQILDIASNSRYGNCLSPGEDGRDFYVTLVPANESPTKRNSYSTLPGEDKYSILDKLPAGWIDDMDNLEQQVAAGKSVAEIQTLVDQAMMQVGLTPPTTTTAPAAQKAVTPPETQRVAAPPAQTPGPAETKTATPEPDEPTPEETAEAAGVVTPDTGKSEDDDVKDKLDALFGGA